MVYVSIRAIGISGGLSRSKLGSGFSLSYSIGERVISAGMEVILGDPVIRKSIELIGMSAIPEREPVERIGSLSVATDPGAPIGGNTSVGERVSRISEATGAINAIGVGLDCCVGRNRPTENPRWMHRLHLQSSIPYCRIQLLGLQH